MNFDFIESLRLTLENSNVFGWKFLMKGCKALALTLLIFKILETYLKDFDPDNTGKIGNILSVFGYAFVIMSGDFIIGSIETAFSGVEKMVFNTPSDLYLRLSEEINEQKLAYYDELGVMGMITMPLDVICQILWTGILGILVSFMKIADMAVTVGYLLTRMFLIQLMKLLFPFVIALSTLDITKDLLGKWIKRYIGLFLLGLAYIGIINFCYLVQDSLLDQFSTLPSGDPTGMGYFVYGACITVVVVFTFKVKMFGTVTSYLSNLFS